MLIVALSNEFFVCDPYDHFRRKSSESRSLYDENCVIDKCDHMDYCPVSEYSTASRAKYLRASVFPCFLFVFKRHLKCHHSFMVDVNSGFVVPLGQMRSRKSRVPFALFSFELFTCNNNIGIKKKRKRSKTKHIYKRIFPINSIA